MTIDSSSDFNRLTRAFYDQNASDFVQRTIDLDMSDLQERFLALLPPHGKILDAGCGSGRDIRYFENRGYFASGFDSSSAMVNLAREFTGVDIQLQTFQEFQANQLYDGIWACASMLHVGRSEIDDVLSRLINGLKLNGVLYMSFKYGTEDRIRNGRLFSNYDETTICELIARHPRVVLADLWSTEDVRPDHSSERWINAIIRRIQE